MRTAKNSTAKFKKRKQQMIDAFDLEITGTLAEFLRSQHLQQILTRLKV
jgi:hypothetical protein